MLQHLLDEQAQTNAISHINPVTKLILGVGALILLLISSSPLVPLISAITLSLVIVGIAKIPIRLYAQILLIPAGFTLISVAAIVLMTGGETIFWSAAITPWLTLNISKEGIVEGISIISRVIGGTISLLLISLTTPFTDIIQIMSRCKVPQELIDLTTILYRNIFILHDQAHQIHSAQVMRLGYSSPREATESFGMLCGSLFISSWNAGDDLIRAMDCRCYDGKFAPLVPFEPIKLQSILPVTLFLLLLVILTMFLASPLTTGGI